MRRLAAIIVTVLLLPAGGAVAQSLAQVCDAARQQGDTRFLKENCAPTPVAEPSRRRPPIHVERAARNSRVAQPATPQPATPQPPAPQPAAPQPAAQPTINDDDALNAEVQARSEAVDARNNAAQAKYQAQVDQWNAQKQALDQSYQAQMEEWRANKQAIEQKGDAEHAAWQAQYQACMAGDTSKCAH
jgi:hypothetical protein